MLNSIDPVFELAPYTIDELRGVIGVASAQGLISPDMAFNLMAKQSLPQFLCEVADLDVKRIGIGKLQEALDCYAPRRSRRAPSPLPKEPFDKIEKIAGRDNQLCSAAVALRKLDRSTFLDFQGILDLLAAICRFFAATHSACQSRGIDPPSLSEVGNYLFVLIGAARSHSMIRVGADLIRSADFANADRLMEAANSDLLLRFSSGCRWLCRQPDYRADFEDFTRIASAQTEWGGRAKVERSLLPITSDPPYKDWSFVLRDRGIVELALEGPDRGWHLRAINRS